MKKLTPLQWIMVVVLLLIFAAMKIAMIYWYEKREPAPQAVADKECNIRHGCTLPDGTLLRTFGALNSKKPFRMIVMNAPAGTQSVYVEFSMKDMDMGFNRYKLLPPDGAHEYWYTDTVRLPVCVVSRKDYLLDVYINGKGYQIAFAAD